MVLFSAALSKHPLDVSSPPIFFQFCDRDVRRRCIPKRMPKRLSANTRNTNVASLRDAYYRVVPIPTLRKSEIFLYGVIKIKPLWGFFGRMRIIIFRQLHVGQNYKQKTDGNASRPSFFQMFGVDNLPVQDALEVEVLGVWHITPGGLVVVRRDVVHDVVDV